MPYVAAISGFRLLIRNRNAVMLLIQEVRGFEVFLILLQWRMQEPIANLIKRHVVILFP